ncbi:sigma factor-like helix-turn-helix DNA-binding protein [Planctomycetota bacterium]
MTNSKPQPDFDPSSVRPLLQALSDVLPGMERLIRAYLDFLPDPTASTQSPSFNSCLAMYNSAKDFDDILKSLPKINQGRSRHENLTGLHPDTIREVHKVKRLDDFERYEACKEFLTNKQYIVVYLRYHEGKTQQEIAEILCKARTTISDLLNRAERKKDEYYKKLRAEEAEFLKKEIEKNEG